MRVVTLRCNECGAPLEVPRKVRFFTCSYCDAPLAIKEEGGAKFTELAAHTAQIAKDVQELKKRSELEELDRSWERERERYMHVSKRGTRSVPEKGTAIFVGVFACFFGAAWMAFAFSITARMPFASAKIFPFLGLAFVGVGLFNALRMFRKADGYTQAQHRYRNRRRELRRKLSS